MRIRGRGSDRTIAGSAREDHGSNLHDRRRRAMPGGVAAWRSPAPIEVALAAASLIALAAVCRLYRGRTQFAEDRTFLDSDRQSQQRRRRGEPRACARGGVSAAGRQAAGGPGAVCVSGAGRRRPPHRCRTSAPSAARALPSAVDRSRSRGDRAARAAGARAGTREGGGTSGRPNRCRAHASAAERDQAVRRRPRSGGGPRFAAPLGALYILAFHAVSRGWRSRALRGDRVLLAAAHVLTAIGFAAMVSRPDPLRDLAAVRPLRARASIAGLAVAGAVSFVNVRTSSLQDR